MRGKGGFDIFGSLKSRRPLSFGGGGGGGGGGARGLAMQERDTRRQGSAKKRESPPLQGGDGGECAHPFLEQDISEYVCLFFCPLFFFLPLTVYF